MSVTVYGNKGKSVSFTAKPKTKGNRVFIEHSCLACDYQTESLEDMIQHKCKRKRDKVAIYE